MQVQSGFLLSIDNHCIRCLPNMQVPVLTNNATRLEGVSTCVCEHGYMLRGSGCVPCEIGFFCNSRGVKPVLLYPFSIFSPIPGLRSSTEYVFWGTKNEADLTFIAWDKPRTSVLTCLGNFVYFDSNVTVNLYKSVYTFSVNTGVLSLDKINQYALGTFFHKNYDIEYNSIQNKITYTTTMQSGFVENLTVILLSNAEMWRSVTASSKINSMSYIYIAHNMFCSIFSAISHKVFADQIAKSRCFVPFRVSTFSSVKLVLKTSALFIQGRRILFGSEMVTTPMILMFKELIAVYNSLDSVFETRSTYPLVLIPVSGNGLAVFMGDRSNSVDMATRNEFAINLRKQVSTEGTLDMKLGDCQHAITNTFGECVIASSNSAKISCSFCEPDISYFDKEHANCTFCTKRKNLNVYFMLRKPKHTVSR